MPWQLTLTYRSPSEAQLDSGPLHNLGCSLLDGDHNSRAPKPWSISVNYPQPGTARVQISLFNDHLSERLRTRILDYRRYRTPTNEWVLDPDACEPPREHPWTQLSRGNPAINRWHVTFHDPGASIVSSDKRSTVDFGPDRVLRHLADRWRHHDPGSCPANTPGDFPSLRVTEITGATIFVGRDRVRAWGENSLWQGRYTYETNRDEARPHRNATADALFAFAELHGIGSRLDRGHGAISITRTTTSSAAHQR